MASIERLEDVAARHLCTGCGVCAHLSPGTVRMVDVEATGRRPLVATGADTSEAFAACPGPGVAGLGTEVDGGIQALVESFGPVLEVWVGFADEGPVRARGASGGVVSALAQLALDEGRAGVLHVAPGGGDLLQSRAVFARDRSELAHGAGARFAPASPLDALDELRAAGGTSVVVGKPCDIAGVVKASAVCEDIGDKVALTIGLLCSGTPPTDATAEVVRELGFSSDDPIDELRYGRRALVVRSGEREASMEWRAAWARMGRRLPWRCRVCADRTAELADLAVGDADALQMTEEGRSLVFVRTPAGRAFLERARRAGVVQLSVVDPAEVGRMSQHAISQRGEVFAAGVAARIAGVSMPRYEGLRLGRYWWRGLGWRSKVLVVFKMLFRILRQGVRRDEQVDVEMSEASRVSS